MEIMAILLLIVLVGFFLYIPIMIAQIRGISEADTSVVAVLSWLGLLFGVTWIIALVLSLVYKPEKSRHFSDIEKLQTLHSLKKAGAISQKEFDAEKKKILSN